MGSEMCIRDSISVGMHANANGVLVQSAKHLKVAQLSNRLGLTE